MISKQYIADGFVIRVQLLYFYAYRCYRKTFYLQTRQTLYRIKNNQYRMCTFMHSIMFGTVFIATQIHFWEMFVMFVKYCTVFRVIRQSKAGKIHIYSELLTGSIASERWRQLL